MSGCYNYRLELQDISSPEDWDGSHRDTGLISSLARLPRTYMTGARGSREPPGLPPGTRAAVCKGMGAAMYEGRRP